MSAWRVKEALFNRNNLHIIVNKASTEDDQKRRTKQDRGFRQKQNQQHPSDLYRLVDTVLDKLQLYLSLISSPGVSLSTLDIHNIKNTEAVVQVISPPAKNLVEKDQMRDHVRLEQISGIQNED